MRYHDFVPAADRLHDEQMDFFGFVPAMTQCEQCDKPVLLRDAVVSTYQITPHLIDQEHYCSEQCAVTAWRKRHGGA